VKNVLITGAGGFIGSHLAEHCVTLGLNVRALVRYNSNSQKGWLENSSMRKNMEIVVGDVRDYDSVKRAVQGCDTIFHLAALIGIPYSYVSPLAYIRTNVEGTYNILQAAREFSVERTIITSTSETYGTAQYIPMDEKHPCIGQSPYSATKIAADNLAISFYRSFSLPLRIARPFNTYGPRQSARAIIPTVIGQLLRGESLRLGNLSPTRDLTFVEDTVRGFLSIATADRVDGQALNIGMGKEISIGELVKLIGRIINVNVNITSDEDRIRPVNSEVERLICNSAKIRELTDWSAVETLETGLTKTIEWYKRRPSQDDNGKYSV